MSECEVCHNQYEKSFTVLMDGVPHDFDSFECAIQALAPKCAHCSCTILGHGLQAGGRYFCCANCARESGVKELKDKV